MFAIYEFSEMVVQIVLPPLSGLPLPWGYGQSVYVLRGPKPVLIDTGHSSARPALMDALCHLGILPDRVQRILLTGSSPSCVGNLAEFPRALAVSTAPIDDTTRDASRERERLAGIVDELLVEPGAPHHWSRDAFAAAAGALFPETDEPVELMVVDDGDAVAAAGLVFDTLSVGGTYGSSSIFYAADRRWLFASDVVNVTPRPMIRDSKALLGSLEKLSSLSVATLFPAQGPIESQPARAFRSATLYVTNLRTNLQYLLNQPRSAAELAYRDLGYWPQDMMRFAARTLEYKMLLEELVDAGVASHERDGERLLYRMGRDQSRHRMA